MLKNNLSTRKITFAQPKSVMKVRGVPFDQKFFGQKKTRTESEKKRSCPQSLKNASVSQDQK